MDKWERLNKEFAKEHGRPVKNLKDG